MPHGVLFRGGEEREARKHFIDHGYLDAVIGLPGNLFYGTGIPACILVLNKAGAADAATMCLFINADREYREGKAQNHLRPEDIDKIIHAYRPGDDVAGLRPPRARAPRSWPRTTTATSAATSTTRRRPSRMTCAPICTAACRSRRSRRWRTSGSNYAGLREGCFRRAPTRPTCDFAPALDRASATLPHSSRSHPGRAGRHAQFMETLEDWWQGHLPMVEALAPDRREPARDVGATSTPCAATLLEEHRTRRSPTSTC